QVVDEAAGARAADRAADAARADAVGHVRDREEVRGHAGRGDDVQLVLEAVAGVPRGARPADARPGGRVRGAVAAAQDRVLAASAERPLLLGGGALRLGQMVGADAEILGRVEGAPAGQL